MKQTHKRLARFSLLILGGLLLLFGILEATGFSMMNAGEWIPDSAGPVAAAISIGILAVDVIAAIPSSIVMTINGKLFGFWVGTCISSVGFVISGILGYAIGRFSQSLLKRMTNSDERREAELLSTRWGAFSIVITRPIPLVAETASICAGAARMPFGKYLLATAAGTVPISTVYALAGSRAEDLASGIWVFVTVMFISGICWWIGKRRPQ